MRFTADLCWIMTISNLICYMYIPYWSKLTQIWLFAHIEMMEIHITYDSEPCAYLYLLNSWLSLPPTLLIIPCYLQPNEKCIRLYSPCQHSQIPALIIILLLAYLKFLSNQTILNILVHVLDIQGITVNSKKSNILFRTLLLPNYKSV